jgi:hypothetical protein
MRNKDQILLEAAYTKILEADSFLEFPQDANKDLASNYGAYDEAQKMKLRGEYWDVLHRDLENNAAADLDKDSARPYEIEDYLYDLTKSPKKRKQFLNFADDALLVYYQDEDRGDEFNEEIKKDFMDFVHRVLAKGQVWVDLSNGVNYIKEIDNILYEK